MIECRCKIIPEDGYLPQFAIPVVLNFDTEEDIMEFVSNNDEKITSVIQLTRK